MTITYTFDEMGCVDRFGSDEWGWLVRTPDSPSGWDLPNATHVGSSSKPDESISLTVWLVVHDGTVDHAMFLTTGDMGTYMRASMLCDAIQGVGVRDLQAALRSEGTPPTGLLGAILSEPPDLPLLALSAALSDGSHHLPADMRKTMSLPPA